MEPTPKLRSPGHELHKTLFQVHSVWELEVDLVGGFSDDRRLSHTLIHQLLSGFDRQDDDIHLVTLRVTELKDREENGNHLPIPMARLSTGQRPGRAEPLPRPRPEEGLRRGRLTARTRDQHFGCKDRKNNTCELYSRMPLPRVEFCAAR